MSATGTEAAVRAVAQRHPQLAEPGRAVNQCRIVSVELVEELEKAGPTDACVVWVQHSRARLEHVAAGAEPENEHALVRLPGGEFVDLTRRQFDRDAEPVTRYAGLDELGEHWDLWQTDSERAAREPQRQLSRRVLEGERAGV